jgi:hypothetical protein
MKFKLTLAALLILSLPVSTQLTLDRTLSLVELAAVADLNDLQRRALPEATI